MTLAWVVGAGGLLGSAVCRALRRQGRPVFLTPHPLAWRDAATLHQQLRDAARQFSAAVDGAPGWEVYWAAGVGSMSARAEALAPETAALTALLDALGADATLMQAPGALALASSAGAIYAGCKDYIVTESSAESPGSAYAREKLAQEAVVRRFVEQHPGQRALLARISSLYGLGRDPAKPTGLLSHIARGVLHHRPVQIYVPFDTLRDYISANDAGAALVTALGLAAQQPVQAQVKIIASERPVSIAEIIALFKRIARRAPRVVTSASRLSGLYPRRVQFRSEVLVPAHRPPTTSLAVGIADLIAAERMAYLRGPRHRDPGGQHRAAT